MKKMFSMLVASAVFFSACNSDKTESDSTTTGTEKSTDGKMSQEEKEERNKKVVMASMEGVNSHNVDVILKDAAPDIADHNDGSMPVTKGIDSARAGISMWLAAFPDVKSENLTFVADGDYVMVWGDWTGTWKGDFMGQKATGKSYKLKDVDVFKLNDDGKIIEHHFVQSPMAQAAQIGMKMQ